MRDWIRQIISKLKTLLPRDQKELPYYILIGLSFLFFILATNLFVELTEELKGPAIHQIDQQITSFFASFRSPGLTRFVVFITDMGDLYGYLVLTALATAIFLLKFKNWKFVLQLLGVLVLASLSNIALKRAINRARPDADHLVVVETLSYPSGHAMSAMAFYGFLIYLLFKIKMATWLRITLFFIFTFMILSIGLSRIYLGVHYPSDVAGGFIAGLIWVAFCITLFNIIDLLRQRKRAEI